MQSYEVIWTMIERNLKEGKDPRGVSAPSQGKRWCLGVAMMAMAAGGAMGAWSDNFDSYANESGIIDQGAWVGWNNVNNDDTIVTDEQAASPPHSLKMGAAAMVDLVPQFSGATSGIWYLDVMTYVPAGSTSMSSDIGFLARHTGFEGAFDTQWFGPFTLNMETGMANDNVPIVRDQWIPMRTVFDIDARTYEIFYNEQFARSGTFPDGFDDAVVGLDVWTPAGASTLYYDDFRMAPAAPEPRDPLFLKITASGDDLVLAWDSKDGELYTLRSAIDLTAAVPLDWSIFDGRADIAATPPRNTLTVPRPVEPVRFFVIEQFDAPPPPPLLSEPFDADALLPDGWTSNGPSNDTDWEVGTPSGVASAPTAANSAPNCVGTNIGGYYTENADVSLVSPSITIPAGSGATLSFRQFIDTDIDGTPHDLGSVRILDADSADAPIAGLEILNIEGDGIAGWTEEMLDLPALDVGGKNIKVEFRFVSNAGTVPDLDVWGGFYVDDVVVTVTVP